ncbi:integrin alpha-M-like [Chiloscyllium punctatum]|uniref:integrin alpha-M-like n=1 Tax=Chiloscyllium punctatum TaxID=137246 RepID=UPI003B63A822
MVFKCGRMGNGGDALDVVVDHVGRTFVVKEEGGHLKFYRIEVVNLGACEEEAERVPVDYVSNYKGGSEVCASIYKSGRREIVCIYRVWSQVENLGDRSVPIGVMLSVPGRLSGQSLWNVSVSPRNQTHRSVCSTPTDTGERSQEIADHNRQENITEDCGIAPCILLSCDVSNLRGHEKVIFDVQGELRTEAITQLNVNQFKLVSRLRLRYDEEKYVDVSNVNNNLKESMIETEVDVLVMSNNLLEIVAGSVAGLFLLVICCVVLYKMGFFKRKKASGDKDQLQEDSPPAPEGSAAEAATAQS